MAASRLAARLFEPGPAAFVLLFAVDTLSRATLAVVLPVVALGALGNARNVSIAYTVAVCMVLAASQAIPVVVRRFGAHRVFVLAALMLLLVPPCLAFANGASVLAAIALRGLATAAGVTALQLMIMAHTDRRDLSKIEPLRVFSSAGVWVAMPLVGIKLYEQIAPWAAYAVTIAFIVLLLVHLALLKAERGPPAGLPARFAPLRNFRRYMAQPRLRLAYVLNMARESWWALLIVYVPIYMVTAGMGADWGGYLVSACFGLLFATPLFGRLARRIGMRPVIMGGFIVTGTAVLLGALATEWPVAFAACIIVAGIGAIALDSISMVTFQRAVRARERPEMTVVFVTYRDTAVLVSTGIYSLLLSFFGLWSVFAAAGLCLLAAAWLARHIPRGM